jgi:NitT/TauT family transport system substrate-binding protein
MSLASQVGDVTNSGDLAKIAVDAPRRREFLTRTCALSAAALLGARHGPAAAEPPPETSRIRLAHMPYICVAPQYLAEELLQLEGFTELEYLAVGTRDGINAVAEGRADMAMWNTPEFINRVDAGKALVALAGVHGGCYELFGSDRVRGIRDLRGKTAAIHYVGSGDHVMLSSMLAYVGIDPKRDVNWITGRDHRNAMDLFADGKADAFVGFAQEPPELRARRVGRVIINTAQDQPWSRYFCCLVVANREFVRRNPVATKRALRAILKAADVCAADPQRAARFLVERLYETRFPIALEVMKSARYDHWREANPEDTLRFHALRLHEVGMIRSTPQALITQGTDWRFLDELKREMKV